MRGVRWTSVSLMQRINQTFRVDSESGCWPWIGPLRHGYGYVRIDGREYVAHRLMACIYFGVDYDSKKVVRHLCGNRKCINPAHLALGTHSDNTQDSIRAGTYNGWGRKNGLVQ